MKNLQTNAPIRTPYKIGPRHKLWNLRLDSLAWCWPRQKLFALKFSSNKYHWLGLCWLNENLQKWFFGVSKKNSIFYLPSYRNCWEIEILCDEDSDPSLVIPTTTSTSSTTPQQWPAVMTVLALKITPPQKWLLPERCKDAFNFLKITHINIIGYWIMTIKDEEPGTETALVLRPARQQSWSSKAVRNPSRPLQLFCFFKPRFNTNKNLIHFSNRLQKNSISHSNKVEIDINLKRKQSISGRTDWNHPGPPF